LFNAHVRSNGIRYNFAEKIIEMKTEKEKEIEEVIIDLVTKEIKECLGDLKSIKDGYEYEEKVLSVVRKIGAIVITKSMGELPKSRNKKNSKPVLEMLK
jgi:hypothetical protein